jgi:hypothetical protein
MHISVLQAVLDVAARMLGVPPLQPDFGAHKKHQRAVGHEEATCCLPGSSIIADHLTMNNARDGQALSGHLQRMPTSNGPVNVSSSGRRSSCSSYKCAKRASSGPYGTVAHCVAEPQLPEGLPTPSGAVGDGSTADASLVCSSCMHEALLMEKRRIAEALLAVSRAPDSWLHPVLAAIVTASSKQQALAGLLATGPLKSFMYVSRKVGKRLRDLFP